VRRSLNPCASGRTSPSRGLQPLNPKNLRLCQPTETREEPKKTQEKPTETHHRRVPLPLRPGPLALPSQVRTTSRPRFFVVRV
jgi:hypothetical protein